MRWTRPRARLASVLLPLALFSIKFRYLGSGDTAPAELLPIQILQRGSLTFELPAGEPLPYWFHASPRGIVSAYPILPGLVNLPVFIGARALGVDLFANRLFLSHVTAALCSLVSIFFVYLILERLLDSPAQALGFAWIYAFGTVVWSVNARALWQHGPALMFLAAGLLALLRRTARADAAAGLLLCLAVLTRPTAILLALPLVAWAVRPEARRLLAIAAGAAPPALLHAAYAWSYWGSPFSLAQPVGAAGFAGDPLQGLAGILVSPARGLFVFSPVFLFAIPASVRAFRRSDDSRSPLMRALVVGSILTVAVYSCWRVWWGGYSFGYRLLAELALPLTILVAWDWPRIRASRLALPLFAIAATLSFFVHALGAYEYPNAFDASVTADPARLWDPLETELTLRVERIFGPLVPAADARLAPWLRPAPRPEPRWWRGETRDDAMPRGLDAPRDGQIVRGTLRVAGWARPADGSAGEVLVSLEPGGRRAAATRVPAPESGEFEAEFPPPARLEAASVLVEVRDARGRAARLGPVDLLWGPARRVHDDAALEHGRAAVPAHDGQPETMRPGR
jgi:hypothetical protein